MGSNQTESYVHNIDEQIQSRLVQHVSLNVSAEILNGEAL